MLQAHEKIDIAIFDVEQNDSLARQVFHAYYRTPDASGAIYRTFPEFFLVKPDILDDALLAFNKQEMPLIESFKQLAELRSGWIGITQYFDKKFSYHWIKYSVYPFMLGDADTDYQDEFFYLLNQFVLFTQQNPTVYGDLTEDASSDNDVALMLAAIRRQASNMDKKLQHYPSVMLLSFDASWPSWQVKTLLAALEVNQQSWNHLFLEHLRYVMRRNKGLVKATTTPLTSNVIADDVPLSTRQSFIDDSTDSKVSLGEPALHAEAPQFDLTVKMLDNTECLAKEFAGNGVAVPILVNEQQIVELSAQQATTGNSIWFNWQEAHWLAHTIKKLSLLGLLLASALAGFLFAYIEQKKISQVDVGLIRPAAMPVSGEDEISNNLIVLESLQMSKHLTTSEPSQ